MRVIVQLIVLIIVLVTALKWGDGPEKALAGILIGLGVIDHIYHALTGNGFRISGMDVGHAVIDGIALVCATVVAIQANRTYTLWFASFQLIAFLSHLGRELVIGAGQIVYVVMIIAPSYFQIVLLGLGTLMHIRRKRRIGKYRSWRNSSPQSLGMSHRK